MTRLLLLEPYGSDSHRSWAVGYAENSVHDVRSVILPGERWRLRMREGAAALDDAARRVCADGWRPESVLVSGMVNVADLRRQLGRWCAPEQLIAYYHENQLAYPDLDVAGRRRDAAHEFGSITIDSFAASDVVVFNSRHHLQEVTASLGLWLPSGSESPLERRPVEVIPVGVDLSQISPAARPPVAELPTILWNHRWDHDKSPQAFFGALEELVDLPWRLAVVGANERIDPQEFTEAREKFAHRIDTWGYQSRSGYLDVLHRADIVVSTADHEYFGVAAVEAIAAGAVPLLPDRLSYPEIVPSRYHDAALYGGDIEAALRTTLTDLAHAQSRVAGLAEAMTVYGWETVAPQLDKLVSRR